MDDGKEVAKMFLKAVVIGGFKHLAFGPVLPILLVALVLLFLWRM